MGTTINIKADVSLAVAELQKLGSQLTKRQLNTGISRGINKTLLLGRTEARTAVKSLYTVAQRALDGRVDIDKSTVYHRQGKGLRDTFLTGAVIASSMPLPMEMFKVSYAYNSTSSSTITKRGVQKTDLRKKRGLQLGGGILIEAMKGKKVLIPYAFFLPTMKGKVFARGKYNPGGGSYGFIQRNKRLTNQNGNDSVKPLLSVTIHAAAINKKAQAMIATRIENNYMRNITHELEVLNNGIVK